MVKFFSLFILLGLVFKPFPIHAGQKDLSQQLVKFELTAKKIAEAIDRDTQNNKKTTTQKIVSAIVRKTKTDKEAMIFFAPFHSLSGIPIARSTANFYFTKFYVNDLSYFNFDKIKVKNFDKIKVKERQKVNLIHPTQSFTLTTLQQLNYIPTKIISKNKSKLISNQLNNLYNNGIYHSKTFLILNKIFSKTKINFKIIEIPINLFIWLMIILLIAYFISKKQNRIGY